MKVKLNDHEIRIELNFNGAEKNALAITAESSRSEKSFEVDISKLWGGGESLTAFVQKSDNCPCIEVVAFHDNSKFACWDVFVAMERDAYEWMYTRIAQLKTLKAEIKLANALIED